MTTGSKLIVACLIGVVVGGSCYGFLQYESQSDLANAASMSEESRQQLTQRVEEGMRMAPAIAFGGAVVGFVAAFSLLWVPRMWRGALRETNQLSKAVQGKLDEPPEDRHRGEGI